MPLIILPLNLKNLVKTRQTRFMRINVRQNYEGKYVEFARSLSCSWCQPLPGGLLAAPPSCTFTSNRPPSPESPPFPLSPSCSSKAPISPWWAAGDAIPTLLHPHPKCPPPLLHPPLGGASPSPASCSSKAPNLVPGGLLAMTCLTCAIMASALSLSTPS